MPAARKPVISAPEQANTSVSKSRDGQTSPTRLLLAGSSRHFIGSLHPSVPPSLHPGHHGGTCHPPFTSTSNRRRSGSRKTGECSTYQRVPGGGGGNSFPVQRQNTKLVFGSGGGSSARPLACLRADCDLSPEATSAPPLGLSDRKVIFAARRLAVMSLVLPHPPGPGQV